MYPAQGLRDNTSARRTRNTDRARASVTTAFETTASETTPSETT
jgi:hypothetical protein